MRKLCLLMTAFFLLASAPAFAQGTTEQKSESKTEATAPSGESTTTTKKTTKKHKHKKSATKKKEAADAGM